MPTTDSGACAVAPPPLPLAYIFPERKPCLEPSRPAAEEPSDAALLARSAGGDLGAFHLFYERYAGRVHAYVQQLSRTREGAEDVVQEVFLAVWRKAASFRPERGDAAGWLYTMTRNKLVDGWRRAAPGTGPGAAPDGVDFQRLPSQRGETTELLLTVRQALARVAPEQRRAIEMAYFGGLTYEETAARLNLPLGTLKSRIRTGLRTMHGVLRERAGA
ncbi:MAG TPA: sigma-70 family RNA polymerase sigma factor [Thermoanaerobaculia bacterium]|nr:sigma-70 family RNA polymerase sigma factor [Thermoanaerobaculia bacterium]